MSRTHRWVLPSVLIVASVIAGGCATQFTSTAPVGNGESIYVSGAYNNQARIWKCPAKSKGECEDVKVSFE